MWFGGEMDQGCYIREGGMVSEKGERERERERNTWVCTRRMSKAIGLKNERG